MSPHASIGPKLWRGFPRQGEHAVGLVSQVECSIRDGPDKVKRGSQGRRGKGPKYPGRDTREERGYNEGRVTSARPMCVQSMTGMYRTYSAPLIRRKFNFAVSRRSAPPNAKRMHQTMSEQLVNGEMHKVPLADAILCSSPGVNAMWRSDRCSEPDVNRPNSR
ncbi:hypothetical protein ACRALDRAFT_2044811 [Sodiomyces alcalophilus JCM 7366]|uniref:uncharacterized protein n=1 Tax=Sodiomyces alcalophilus JCM 7366 TaxID=591952 RepID=UPI0039B50425